MRAEGNVPGLGDLTGSPSYVAMRLLPAVSWSLKIEAASYKLLYEAASLRPFVLRPAYWLTSTTVAALQDEYVTSA